MSSDGEMAFLQRILADKPEYRAITDYLTARGKMPEMQTRWLGDGVNGRFDRNSVFGDELPKGGRITISSNPNAVDQKGTVVHELTHAVDAELINQYHSKKQPPGKQFSDAYKKLRLGSDANVAKTIAPEFALANRDYRASNTEVRAFGMGSTQGGNSPYPAPAHIDSTAATEFQILLDLAMRDQVSAPKEKK